MSIHTFIDFYFLPSSTLQATNKEPTALNPCMHGVREDKTHFVYKSANYLSVMSFFSWSIANHMQHATLVLKSEIGSNFKVKLPTNISRLAHNR
jgi:hypothetical protein